MRWLAVPLPLLVEVALAVLASPAKRRRAEW